MSNLKKHIIAVAVLATFAGAAQAATSVTLYGRLDVGYDKSTGTVVGLNKGLVQSGNGETRLGIKGTEDLGNGMQATFQMEGRFEADTGSKPTNRTFFDRESTVGLKFNLGAVATHVRLGRSISPMEQALGFVNPGRRILDINPYASASRHSNALFINHTYGAFSFGGDITTKGGYRDGFETIGGTPNTPVTNEGISGEKAAYGLFAKYKAHGLEVGAVYQADNADKLTNPTLKTSGQNVNREWGIGAAYTYKMITAGASYAQGKGDGSTAAREYHTKVLSAFVSGKLTANDTVSLIYRQNKAKNEVAATSALVSSAKTSTYGMEYVHSLSKRTSAYADFAHVNYHTLTTSTHKNTWGIALRHNF